MRSLLVASLLLAPVLAMAQPVPPPGLARSKNLSDVASLINAQQNLQAGLPPNARAPRPDDDVTKGYLEPGSVASATYATFGSGYTTATATLTAPPAGGVQATVTPVVFGGQITQFIVTNPGKGYVTAPNVTIVGDGSGATATTSLSTGSLWYSPDKTVWQCLRADAGAAVWYPLRVGNVLPGDVGPTMLGMYGTRRLVTAYVTNKLFDLTRASDSSVKTIGFSGDIVDAATADAFCVGTTCTVSKIYDQSGAANDLTQSDPQIALTWGTARVAGVRALSSISEQSAIPVLAATIASGGSGYVSGDIGKTVTVQGGTINTAAQVTISAVATGAVTGVTVSTAGSYGSPPANPATTTGGGTTGTGLTLTLKYPFVSLSGTVTSYTPKNTTLLWVGAPRTTLQTNNIVNMGTTTDWNYYWGQNLGLGLAVNTSRGNGVIPETTDALDVFSASNAVITTYGNNAQGGFTSAAAGPASTTALSLGMSSEIPQVRGPALSDTAAWMIWSAVPSATQLLNMRAAAIATFGMTPQANDVWVAQGDSITVGHKSVDLRGYPRQALPSLAETVRLYNVGVTGTTLAVKSTTTSFNSEMVRLYDPLARRFVVTVALGTNDVGAGTSGPTIYANLQTYVASLKALGTNVRVIVSTLLPRSALTGPQQTALTAYNTSIQTLWNASQSSGGLGADGLADFASDTTMGASTAPSNTALYVDGLHPTTLGYGYLAAIMAKQVNYQLSH